MMTWKLPRPVLSHVAMIAMALGLMTFASSSALADLRVCNKTENRIGIALGYKDDQGWITEGWWNVSGSACETLLRGPLVSRYYYIYAIDYDAGGEWTGSAYMCSQDRVFTIRGINECSDRGFDKTGFLEIDTGEERDWTVQLVEPGQTGKGG